MHTFDRVAYFKLVLRGNECAAGRGDETFRAACVARKDRLCSFVSLDPWELWRRTGRRIFTVVYASGRSHVYRVPRAKVRA
jgi:hypothetical protein